MSGSYQMSLPPRVVTPLALSWIFAIGYLVTRLPREPRPLIARVEKSYSSWDFLMPFLGRRPIFTVSASPLWFTVNQRILDPSAPVVMSYSLSRVMEVMAKRLA